MYQPDAGQKPKIRFDLNQWWFKKNLIFTKEIPNHIYCIYLIEKKERPTQKPIWKKMHYWR